MTEQVQAAQAEEAVKTEEAVQVQEPAQSQEVAADAEKKEQDNPLLRKIEVSVAKADVETRARAELKRIAKKAKMPGFRPGHVPMAMIEASHGYEVRTEALNDLINEAFRAAIEEQKLPVVSLEDCQPKADAETDEAYVFVLSFETIPEVVIPDVKPLGLKRYVCPVTDEAVKKTIDIIVKQRVTYETEEGRAAAADDMVCIDFKGTKDGEAFNGGTAEDFEFVLGQGRMLPEFETAVTGMSAGQSKTFDLTFPENYGNAELAGKAVVFEVTCKQVQKPIYPELNDEFAKQLGVDNLAELEKSVRQNLDREVKARLLARNKSEVFDALEKNCTFAVPRVMREREAEDMANEFAERMISQSGLDRKQAQKLAKNLKPATSMFTEQATKRCRLSMACEKIVTDAKIEVTDADIDAYVADIAQAYEDPKGYADQMAQDKQARANMAQFLLEGKVLEHILVQAEASEEEVPFDELMGH